MSNTIKGNTVIDRLKKESPDAIMKLYCNGGPYVQCIRYKEYNAAKSIIFSSDITCKTEYTVNEFIDAITDYMKHYSCNPDQTDIKIKNHEGKIMPLTGISSNCYQVCLECGK